MSWSLNTPKYIRLSATNTHSDDPLTKPLTSKTYPEITESSDSQDSVVLDTYLHSDCPTCGRTLNKNNDKNRNRLTFWITLVTCLLCTCVNSFLILHSPNLAPTARSNAGSNTNRYFDPLASIPRSQYPYLRRPSPYIGLGNITRPVPPTPRTIINYPQVIAQVDADNKDLVFDDDPLRYMTRAGAVSPEDRMVRASSSISTILQFRTIDFGMESCELKVRLPSPNSTARPYMLSLYRLNTTTPVDTKTLSYKTRPQRAVHVANIMVDPESASSSAGPVTIDWNRNFSCMWDELLTFEFACYGSGGGYDGDNHPGFAENQGECNIEWWQDRLEPDEDPGTGIFMIQHATV